MSAPWPAPVNVYIIFYRSCQIAQSSWVSPEESLLFGEGRRGEGREGWGISPWLRDRGLSRGSSASYYGWINKLGRYVPLSVVTAQGWKEEGTVRRDNAGRAQFPHVVSAEWLEGILMKASSLEQDPACLPLVHVSPCSRACDPVSSAHIKHSIINYWYFPFSNSQCLN